MIRERPELANYDASVNTFPEWRKDNLGSSLNPQTHDAKCRAESRRDERAEEEECTRLSLSLSHSLTKCSNTPPYKVVRIPLSFPCGTKLPLQPLTCELPPTWAQMGCHKCGL